MYRCLRCDEEFYEPNTVETSYESYYGVSSEFTGSTPLTLKICPYCNSDEIEEFEEVEEYEEEEEE